jgi:hypothetical protein
VKKPGAVLNASRLRGTVKGDVGNRPIRQPKMVTHAGRQKPCGMVVRWGFAASMAGLTGGLTRLRPLLFRRVAFLKQGARSARPRNRVA